MKSNSRDDIIVHYIPEIYNDNIDKNTGREYGWIQSEKSKKPYTTRSQAMNALNRSLWDGVKKRIRVETFKCVDVKFEEII